MLPDEDSKWNASVFFHRKYVRAYNLDKNGIFSIFGKIF